MNAIEKEVVILTGAGQIGMSIARRMGYGKKIIIGDKNLNNAQSIAKIMCDAGFDVVPMEVDISSRDSIKILIDESRGDVSDDGERNKRGGNNLVKVIL